MLNVFRMSLRGWLFFFFFFFFFCCFFFVWLGGPIAEAGGEVGSSKTCFISPAPSNLLLTVPMWYGTSCAVPLCFMLLGQCVYGLQQ